jgi:hypothetical protein
MHPVLVGTALDALHPVLVGVDPLHPVHPVLVSPGLPFSRDCTIAENGRKSQTFKRPKKIVLRKSARLK